MLRGSLCRRLKSLTPIGAAHIFPIERVAKHDTEMAIRAKLTVLLCALLGGLCALACAPNAATAHPGHHHGPPAAHSPTRAPVAVAPAAASEEHASQRPEVLKRSGPNWADVHLASSRPKAPQPFHANNCCCGSIACHAGVEPSAAPLVDPSSLTQRFVLPPVLPMAGGVWGGIERPPRGPVAL